MKKCAIEWCESTELVFSGVASLALGVPVATVCYNHVEYYAHQKSKEVA